MARKRLPPNDPREWLNRARSSLARARTVIRDVYLEDLCFDAQQAAEKAIKAVFIHRGTPFPYTHNLADLVLRLQRSGLKVPKYVRAAKQADALRRRVTISDAGPSCHAQRAPSPRSSGDSRRCVG
jgi:HEPN domain-containing protein